MVHHKKTSTNTHEKETRQDIWPQERLPVTKRNYARQEMHYRSSLESPRSTPFRDGPATTHLYRHTVQQQSHLISARNAAPTIGPGPCIQGDSPARCREFRFKDEQPVFHQFRLESSPPPLRERELDMSIRIEPAHHYETFHSRCFASLEQIQKRISEIDP